MKRKSIGDRLRSAGSQEVVREIAADWTTNWEREMEHLLSELGIAVAEDDFETSSRMVGQLRAVARKRFGALPRIYDALIDKG